MASHSTLQAELVKIEQIVSEFFVKSLHIILDARIPFVCSHTGEHSGASSSSSSSSSGPRVRDRWFNLALGEFPAALENMELRRRITLEPMIVDVILLQSSGHGDGSCTSSVHTEKQNFLIGAPSRGSRLNYWSAEGEEFPQSEELGAQTILERWIVQYEYRKPSTRDISMGRTWSTGGPPRQEDGRKMSGNFRRGKGRGGSGMTEVEPGSGSPQVSSHAMEVPAAYKRIYKRTIILLRSLYCTARLLPAYRLFRLISSSGHNHNFSLGYRVSSLLEPLASVVEAEMQSYSFTPVETPSGRICLSLLYRPNTVVATVEGSTPLSPQIIQDYVGSPAVDPLKRFPCDSPLTPSKKGLHAISLPLSAPGSPACAGFARRHSWSGGIHKMLPSSQSPLSPKYRISFSPSPSASPSYSDIHGSPTNSPAACPAPRRHRPVDHSPSPRNSPLHPSSAEASSCLPPSYQKATSYDEYRFTPPFSPSPSPSPPTHLRGDNSSRVLVRCESAPVCIPNALLGRSPRCLTVDYYNQNKTLLPPPSCKSRKPETLPQTTSASSGILSAQFPICQGSPSEGRSGKCGVSRPTEFQTGVAILQTYSGQKVRKDEKDDSGQMPGVNISSTGSPQFPFSRSFSKLPYQDDVEDDDFSCPFAVDDDEIAECRSRAESLDGKGNVCEPLGTVGQTITMPKKSQNAAVGALIHMLKSAQPLCTTSANLPEFSQTVTQILRADPWRGTSCAQNISKEPGVSSLCGASFHSGREASGLFVHKTAADALEELRSYREIKDNLLSQNGTPAVRRPVNM